MLIVDIDRFSCIPDHSCIRRFPLRNTFPCIIDQVISGRDLIISFLDQEGCSIQQFRDFNTVPCLDPLSSTTRRSIESSFILFALPFSFRNNRTQFRKNGFPGRHKPMCLDIINTIIALRILYIIFSCIVDGIVFPFLANINTEAEFLWIPLCRNRSGFSIVLPQLFRNDQRFLRIRTDMIIIDYLFPVSYLGSSDRIIFSPINRRNRIFTSQFFIICINMIIRFRIHAAFPDIILSFFIRELN